MRAHGVVEIFWDRVGPFGINSFIAFASASLALVFISGPVILGDFEIIPDFWGDGSGGQGVETPLR